MAKSITLMARAWLPMGRGPQACPHPASRHSGTTPLLRPHTRWPWYFVLNSLACLTWKKIKYTLVLQLLVCTSLYNKIIIDYRNFYWKCSVWLKFIKKNYGCNYFASLSLVTQKWGFADKQFLIIDFIFQRRLFVVVVAQKGNETADWVRLLYLRCALSAQFCVVPNKWLVTEEILARNKCFPNIYDVFYHLMPFSLFSIDRESEVGRLAERDAPISLLFSAS
jgi:hypothetical protein